MSTEFQPPPPREPVVWTAGQTVAMLLMLLLAFFAILYQVGFLAGLLFVGAYLGLGELLSNQEKQASERGASALEIRMWRSVGWFGTFCLSIILAALTAGTLRDKVISFGILFALSLAIRGIDLWHGEKYSQIRRKRAEREAIRVAAQLAQQSPVTDTQSQQVYDRETRQL